MERGRACGLVCCVTENPHATSSNWEISRRKGTPPSLPLDRWLAAPLFIVYSYHCGLGRSFLQILNFWTKRKHHCIRRFAHNGGWGMDGQANTPKNMNEDQMTRAEKPRGCKLQTQTRGHQIPTERLQLPWVALTGVGGAGTI